MKVLFAASEFSPLAKVGGLADVVGSLPLTLKKLGVDVRVVLPKYEVIDEKKYNLKLVQEGIEVKIGKIKEKINLFETEIGQEKLKVYLVENQKYLSQDGIYFERTAFCGSFAEIQRFLFFSSAVLFLFSNFPWQPQIIHLHDWHTAFVPVLSKIYFPKIKTKFLYTIHNLANQGRCNAKEILGFFGLKGDEVPSLKERQGEDLNLMQQGILNVDFLTTVSPTYAEEILFKSYFSRGLKKSLVYRRKDLKGILNGLDTEVFNPATDPCLYLNYSFKNPELKKENKIYLEKKLGLKVSEEAPFFGMISRLTYQKGVELVAKGFPKIQDFDFRAVFLGLGEPRYEKALSDLSEKFKGKIATKIGFDPKLAQEIYAGVDFFLVPSKFEPCGLTQMIALRYGAIPIVRKVGGLADTVKNIKIKKQFLGLISKLEGNGFVFREYDADKFVKVLKKAISFHQNKKLMSKLQKKVMREDYSWEKSAREYLRLYEKL